MNITQMAESGHTEPLAGVEFNDVMLIATQMLLRSLTNPVLGILRRSAPHLTSDTLVNVTKEAAMPKKETARKFWLCFFFGTDWNEVERAALLLDVDMSIAFSDDAVETSKFEAYSQN